MIPGLSPRSARLWLVAGTATIAVGSAVAALPWYVAGAYGVPFGGPEPFAFLAVIAIASVAVAGIVGLWARIARLQRAYRW